MSKNKYGALKWGLRALAGLGVAVFCYFMLSLVLDTPLEREIKKSTAKLEQEYAKLSTRYDTLVQVINNVNQRDSAVYRIIFESDPYNPQKDSTSTSDLGYSYDKLLLMTNKEMGDEFVQRAGLLYQRTYNLESRQQEMENYFYDNRDKINAIPSIQPVINPDLTLLAASYGNRIHPFYKSMVFHKGVDYSVPVGSAVFATADGVVDMIQSRGNESGLTLKLAHGSGYSTTYAHLDRIIVNVGNRVQRGDIVAFSGNSGLSYAPHLHYQVNLGKEPVDPLNFFFMELDMDGMSRIKEIAHTGMQSFD